MNIVLPNDYEVQAAFSYAYADAMLRERLK